MLCFKESYIPIGGNCDDSELGETAAPSGTASEPAVAAVSVAAGLPAAVAAEPGFRETSAGS